MNEEAKSHYFYILTPSAWTRRVQVQTEVARRENRIPVIIKLSVNFQLKVEFQDDEVWSLEPKTLKRGISTGMHIKTWKKL